MSIVKTSAAVLSPSIGPATLVILGETIPTMAMILSLGGVVLARYIAPPPKEIASSQKAIALTFLLCVVDFAAVLTLQPGVGLGVVAGVSLGFSGMIGIRLIGRRVEAIVNALTAHTPDPPSRGDSS